MRMLPLGCKHCQLACHEVQANPDWRPSESASLPDDELAELFPDPTLIGDRLAKLTSALGIPPCGGCGHRCDWLNRAHLWLQNQFTAASLHAAR